MVDWEDFPKWQNCARFGHLKAPPAGIPTLIRDAYRARVAVSGGKRHLPPADISLITDFHFAGNPSRPRNYDDMDLLSFSGKKTHINGDDNNEAEDPYALSGYKPHLLRRTENLANSSSNMSSDKVKTLITGGDITEEKRQLKKRPEWTSETMDEILRHEQKIIDCYLNNRRQKRPNPFPTISEDPTMLPLDIRPSRRSIKPPTQLNNERHSKTYTNVLFKESNSYSADQNPSKRLLPTKSLFLSQLNVDVTAPEEPLDPVDPLVTAELSSDRIKDCLTDGFEDTSPVCSAVQKGPLDHPDMVFPRNDDDASLWCSKTT